MFLLQHIVCRLYFQCVCRFVFVVYVFLLFFVVAVVWWVMLAWRRRQYGLVHGSRPPDPGT